jgi:xanthine dehydrogenase iron-sulfur cluster and FAD-binding subunit A
LSRFAKLGSRRYLVISIAMVAITLDFGSDERVSRCGIAVGSCSASARRLAAIEAALLSTPRRMLGQRVAQLLAAGEPLAAVLTPIDDVRGTASYRLHVVGELLQRLFGDIADEA